MARNIAELDTRFTGLGYVYPGGVTAATKTALGILPFSSLIGFVTQEQTLLGNLPVLDNVILPATFFPDGPGEDLMDRALGLLRELGVEDIAGCRRRRTHGHARSGRGQLRRHGISNGCRGAVPGIGVYWSFVSAARRIRLES